MVPQAIWTKQSQIDYAALQIGRIYEQLEQFKEMEDWFERYLEKYGINGDYTQAIYRRGFAQQAQGRSKDALDTYWHAIEKYGNDPKAMGIDIIIDAYCEEYRGLNGSQPLDLIRAAALTATEEKERTRALRFERALAEMNAPDAPSVLAPADIALASPAVLLWMAQGAAKTDPALAESAARAAIDNFGPTQWTGEAFLRLGNFAFEKRDWNQAESAFNNAIKSSPMNMTAARAMIRRGDQTLRTSTAGQGMEGRVVARSSLRDRRKPKNPGEGKGSVCLLSTHLRSLPSL
jgi:tetratricopeptide (TPR) repeat protein